MERSSLNAPGSGAAQGPQGHLQEHIDLIAKHEQDFLAQRTSAEKLSDRLATFIGSLTYVGIHLVLAALWITTNMLPGLPFRRIDPFPFPLMDLGLSLEAILVASFILMRQSRVSRRSDERDHLMLQILLLTEREVTAVLGMERKIAEHIGLRKAAADSEVTLLSEQTSIDEVANIIKESLPSEL